MPEFSPERARLLAERPAHPWTPPDGVVETQVEDDLPNPTEGETVSEGIYEEIEQDWLDGNISHAEACEIAREMGYDDDE